MMKTAIYASLMLAGAPALAQTAPTGSQAGPPSTTTTTQPSGGQNSPMTTAPTGTGQSTTGTSTQPAMGQSSTQPTTGTQSTTGTDAATSGTQGSAGASTTSAAAAVDADWAKYDTNKNNRLSRTELNKWLTDLQGPTGKKPTRTYLSSAFQKADTDRSRSVSKAELTAFLQQ